MKKVVLTESQIKNLISKIVLEQSSNRTEKITIPLNVNWKEGYWKLRSEQLESLKTQVQPMIDFINKHTNSLVQIQIESGESRITNYDNEAKDRTKLEPGVLAKNRGNTMVQYLKGLFKQLLSDGLIQNEPDIPEATPIIGDTEYKPFSTTLRKDKNNRIINQADHDFYRSNLENYRKEQFVRAVLSLKKDYRCLVGLQITVGYDNNGTHHCDEAIFELRMNGVPVGVVNLNNGEADVYGFSPKTNPNVQSIIGHLSPEEQNQRKEYFVKLHKEFEALGRKTDGMYKGFRSQTVVVDDAKARSIIKDGDEIILSMKPLVDDSGPYKILSVEGSHTEVPWVLIKNKDNDTLYRKDYPNVRIPRGSMDETKLIKLDNCGKQLEVYKRPNPEPTNRRIDYNEY